MTDDRYEVFAVRYGSIPTRTRRENFIGLDPHEAAPMPLDFYVWVIRNEARTIVVDTGFEHEEAARRGRRLERLPREGLAMLGVDTGAVEDVIITHMHNDHAGTLDDFPNARFHLQEAEMGYVTGACMCHEALRAPYSVEHVCAMVRTDLFRPGGLQGRRRRDRARCHRPHARRPFQGHPVRQGRDRARPRRPRLRHRPFLREPGAEPPLPHHPRRREDAPRLRPPARPGTQPRAYRPGHDPLVLQRYPAVDACLDGIACRLDLAPAG
jgi:hypothetical protein